MSFQFYALIFFLVVFYYLTLNYFNKKSEQQAKTTWLAAVELLMQKAVQLKNRAGHPQWYHYHHQDWRSDYYSWLKNLLSAVDEQYGPEKRDFVKGFITENPENLKLPEWPVGDIQNFITEEVWKFEGELEWLYAEHEKLKTGRYKK